MIYTILFVLAVVVGGLSVEISEEVKQYCISVLEKYDADQSAIGFQGIIEPGVCPNDDIFNIEDYFLPKILIWCPISKFRTQVKCPEHNICLKTGPWNINKKNNGDPRLLLDTNANVLLLSRYYVCSMPGFYHKIISTDVRLINQLPEFIGIPFIISHRSSCTVRFFTYLMVQIGHGVSFSEIAESLRQLSFEEFCQRKRHMLLMCAQNNMQPLQRYIDDSAFNIDPIFTCATDSYLRDIFLRYFRGAKSLYDEDMSTLTALSISMDHTFKICKNIGATRSVDKRWVTQFGSLFVVMNECGEIIKWSLCSGEGFDEIRTALCELRDRLQSQGNHLTHIMVDICCKWRGKLREVFGEGLLVKLDLFHAVQRLSSKISQKCKFKRDCINDFSLVFRQSSDRGKIREEPTASPSIISMQLDQFLKKWGDANDLELLNTEALKEVNNIRQHIIKGCLSDIPVGHGTQRNEGLHSLINRCLISGATHIGVELACALLTVLFHLTNAKVRRKQKFHPRTPLLLGPFSRSCSSSNVKEATEHFGLFAEDHISHTVEPTDSLVNSSDTCDPFCDHSFDLSEVYDVDTLPREFIKFLAQKSLNLYGLLENISKRCSSKTVNPWEFPCFVALNLLCVVGSRFDKISEQEIVHAQRLQARLNGFKRRLEPVDKDGNCAFTSLACQISRLFDTDLSPAFVFHLSSLGLNSRQPVSSMSRTLRSLYVKELLSCSEDYFPHTFNMTMDQFKEAASAFNNEGVYNNQLGDFVMKAMSKVIGCAVMIITSLTSCEVIPFIPSEVRWREALYIAYNHYGSGHYDSTIQNEVKVSDDREIQAVFSTSCQRRCRCGRDKVKDDPEYVSCTNTNNGKYATRCPCHKSFQGCSSNCRCINCGNEHGKKTLIPDVQSSGVGSRNRYILASNKRRRSETFITDQNKEIKQGPWSNAETCVIETIIRNLDRSSIEKSSDNVHKVYNQIAKSEYSSELGLAIRPKTLDQVKGKLKFREERSKLSAIFTAQELRYTLSDM